MTDQFESLKEYLYQIHNQNPFMELLQMRVVELTEGTAKLTMPIASIHTNLYNVAHGGAVASLADATMGVACATTGKKVLTLELNMNFIRAAKPSSTITAVGKVVHNGSRTMVAEVAISDEMTNLLLKARATFFVID